MEDRTSEFLSLAQSLPPSTAQQSAPPPPPPVSNNTQQANADLRTFHKTAADISKDIAATSALLSELTGLVRHKSLFQDDTPRVNHLVASIKYSIENLNVRLDQAGAVLQSHRRHVNKQAGEEAANLVQGLQTEFAQAASGFKTILQQRTDTLKETQTMQKQVYGNSNAFGGDADDDDIPNISLTAPPPVWGATRPAESNSDRQSFPTLDLTSSLMAAGQDTNSRFDYGGGGGNNSSGMRNRRGTSQDYAAYDPDSSVYQTPLDLQRMDEESGLMQDLIPNQEYFQQRANAMSQVESNIVELGTIFNKLAVMVSEHRELVQRVEDNVEDANAHINLSLGALTDTLESLTSGKMLALKLMSILTVFIILFIVFFA